MTANVQNCAVDYTDGHAKLEVWGLDKEQYLSDEGDTAPFMVHDIEGQELIAGPFSTRESAEKHRTEILNGVAPALEREKLYAMLNGNVEVAAITASY